MHIRVLPAHDPDAVIALAASILLAKNGLREGIGGLGLVRTSQTREEIALPHLMIGDTGPQILTDKGLTVHAVKDIGHLRPPAR